ncbi:hypothetical protein HIM_07153 [Hirsutella minnesotensis 3608]|uniref:PLD phosphodiesterase domain-containing protein n=1 Tax=Hirsutella minnesotensis 3608 TaxID=1043627 RepID=A0A0F8A4C9_9HYPO|nr:hypothetical protein HIM_07153 [Hirsutella minnesotensis 3608]
MTGPEPTATDENPDWDDDEALRVAIALSLQDQRQGSPPVTQAHEARSVELADRPVSPSPVASLNMHSLNRRKMEEERLARLAKKRPRCPSDDDDVVEVPPPTKRPSHTPAQGPAPQLESAVPFPDGVVKRTWVRGYPRSGNDIKIEEIFQRDKLVLAMLSSFQWDEEWILSKIDITRTKLLLAAFATDEAQKDSMRANVPPNVKFCFPQMHGPGSMHSKLQLLKFPQHLRVVVPTGNLVPYDWGETGVMENMVFLIDLPRKAEESTSQPTLFQSELERFLRAMGVDEKMVCSLASYDFSRTASLGFVHSSPGGHTGESLKRTGYCGLGTTIASLGLTTTEPVEVDVACASLGSIKCDLVEAMYNACQGDNGMKEYNKRANRKAGDKQPGPSKLLQDRFRIYFPTKQTVSDSRGGNGAAGTICIQARWWRAPDFPRALVRDCVNTRKGLLMHSKLIFVRKAQGSYQGPQPEISWAGWAYVGSANLSESAWGRMVKDRQSGNPKMSCRNWECGVVIPVRQTSSGSGDATDLHVFDDSVPVPMQVPGRKYGPNEEPWFYAGA